MPLTKTRFQSNVSANGLGDTQGTGSPILTYARALYLWRAKACVSILPNKELEEGFVSPQNVQCGSVGRVLVWPGRRKHCTVVAAVVTSCSLEVSLAVVTCRREEQSCAHPLSHKALPPGGFIVSYKGKSQRVISFSYPRIYRHLTVAGWGERQLRVLSLLSSQQLLGGSSFLPWVASCAAVKTPIHTRRSPSHSRVEPCLCFPCGLE